MANKYYTIEEVGARIREQNPDTFSKFTDYQIGERAILRNPELIRATDIKPVTTGSWAGEAIVNFVDNSKFISGVTEATKRRADIVSNAIDMPYSTLEKAYKLSSQAFGLGYDIGAEAIKSGARAVTPKPLEEPLGQAITGIVGVAVENPPISSIISSYEKFKQAHPRIAYNLESTALLAPTVPLGKAGSFVMGQAKRLGTALGREAETAVTGARTALGEAAGEIATGGMRAATQLGEKVSDVITPIPPGVKTVLQNPQTPIEIMAKKFAKYRQQAETAVADYSAATPLELAGQVAEQALKELNNSLNRIGAVKSSLTAGLAGLDVKTLVKEARQYMKTQIEERTGTALKAGETESATGRLSKISDPSDIKLLLDIDSKLKALQKGATFQQVDDLVDYIQDALFKRTANLAQPVNSQVEAILKSVTRQLNEGLKNTAKTSGDLLYRGMNELYASRVVIRDRLNKALGLDANKGASLMKQLFSPSGTVPRKLFAQVKAITGIDLVEEATLAKFVMEHVGDARQASLLEQAIRGNMFTRAGIVNRGLDYLLQQLQRPLEKAERLIRNRPPGTQ